VKSSSKFMELSKTFAEIAASCGAVDGCGATQEPAGKQHKPSWESHIRQHAGRHRRKQAWISVYTSIQILARDVKRFTPALCEQVEG